MLGPLMIDLRKTTRLVAASGKRVSGFGAVAPFEGGFCITKPISGKGELVSPFASYAGCGDIQAVLFIGRTLLFLSFI